MSLSFCVLASGSAGNCTVVRLRSPGGDRHILIDAGLSPRRTAARLAPLGVGVEDLSDLLLTHLDRDHLHQGWRTVLPRADLAVHVHRRHRHQAPRAGVPVSHLRVFDDQLDLAEAATTVQTLLLAHDQMGAVGYVIDHQGARLGFATDLGQVPRALLDLFVDLDALAMESNYDRVMQMRSGRPPALTRRIMSGRGHLSNEEALRAVLAIAGRSRLAHVVLLHLSRQCNHPRLVKDLYTRAAPRLVDRLTITSQHEATPFLHVRRPAATAGSARHGEQMVLF